MKCFETKWRTTSASRTRTSAIFANPLRARQFTAADIAIQAVIRATSCSLKGEHL
jgi:hypothetical protein